NPVPLRSSALSNRLPLFRCGTKSTQSIQKVRSKIKHLVVISRSQLARLKPNSPLVNPASISFSKLYRSVIRPGKPRGIIDGAGHSLLKRTAQVLFFRNDQLLSVSCNQDARTAHSQECDYLPYTGG